MHLENDYDYNTYSVIPNYGTNETYVILNNMYILLLDDPKSNLHSN